MNTIYLSHSIQVVEGTVFRKHTVYKTMIHIIKVFLDLLGDHPKVTPKCTYYSLYKYSNTKLVLKIIMFLYSVEKPQKKFFS